MSDIGDTSWGMETGKCLFNVNSYGVGIRNKSEDQTNNTIRQVKTQILQMKNINRDAYIPLIDTQESPFKNFLSGTELLQSPVRTELSM